jgi:1-acyl-sn-glycerol-3-phosphate acyltransferase
MSNYSKRDVKVYNKFRTIFQWIVCNIFLGAYVNLMYDYKVEGKENVVKDERFIVAANHISGIDPFLVAYAIGVPVAFMAKIELFENFFSRLI